MKKKGSSLFLAVASAVLVLTFCDPNYFGRQLTRNSSIEPDDITITPIDVPDGADSSQDYFAVEATYPPPTEIGTVTPEILFIADSSGSMSGEVDALNAALGGWLTNLYDQGIKHFCVDVMVGHVGAKSGRLQAANGNPKCLCTDQYGNDAAGIAQIVDKFQENITAASTGESASDGGEANLYSLHTGLTDTAKKNANIGDGCFRNDMALAVIALSDEDEIMTSIDGTDTPNCAGDNGETSDGSPIADLSTIEFDNTGFKYIATSYSTSNPNSNGYNPIDTECGEVAARLKYYSKPNPNGSGKYELLITPDSVANELVDYNDALPSFASAVVYKPGTNTFPHVDENGPGHGYFEFADIFGQNVADLSTANNQSAFNAQLNDIADALVDVVSYRYKYDLLDEDLNPLPVCPGQEASLKVRINGTLIASTKYDLNSAGTWFKFKPNFNWTQYGTSPDVTATYTSCE